jgi:hypothetical protein
VSDRPVWVCSEPVASALREIEWEKRNPRAAISPAPKPYDALAEHQEWQRKRNDRTSYRASRIQVQRRGPRTLDDPEMVPEQVAALHHLIYDLSLVIQEAEAEGDLQRCADAWDYRERCWECLRTLGEYVP